MIASEWLEQGRKASSPIEAFNSFWYGFNNLYGHDSRREIDRIKDYLSERIPPNIAQMVIFTNSKQVTYLLSQPIMDMRGNGRDTAIAIAAFKATEKPLDQLHEIFAIIYQVRCNLLHGQKSPNGDRDLQLCKYSAAIVDAVVAHIVSDLNSD